MTSDFEGLFEGQGQVAEGAKKMGEQAAAGHDKATAAADRYLKKLDQLQAKQRMVSITPSGRDVGTVFGDSHIVAGLESSIAEAERTE